MEQIDLVERLEDEDLKQRLLEGEDEVSEEIEPVVKLSYEDFNYDQLNVYAGIDCIGTLGLLERLLPTLTQEDGVINVDLEGKKTPGYAPPIIQSFLDIEIPAHEFIIDLEINGMGYSIPRNQFLAKKMVEEVAGLDDKIFTQIGKKIDLNSGPVVAEFLYGQKGLEVPFLTKSGEPATDGMALLTLAGLDPLGNKYVTKDASLQYLADMAKRKDINSVYNTFIKNYVKDFVKRDGRIHCSYNMFGTASFRISGSDPNLTQLPRPKHGYNVRTCYTEDPGYVFISIDFSSAECKILANIAQESSMLKAIENGLDFHTFSASAAKGIPYEEMMGVLKDQNHKLYSEYKGLRQIMKILTFSIDNGTNLW